MYPEVRKLAPGGPAPDGMRREIARMNGDAAANLVDAAARFEVLRTSPLTGTERIREQTV